MTNSSPLEIETPAEICALLYNRLGYRNILDDEEERSFSVVVGNPFAAAIAPFIITFQGAKGNPIYETGIKEAMQQLLTFLPFSVAAKQEIAISLDHLFGLLASGGNRICRQHNPVAYFLTKAHKLSGFTLLGLAARNIILDEGPHLIPALLVACSVIPTGTDHFNLRGQDILSTENYVKKNGSYLLQATQSGYATILERLLKEIRKLYSLLGYGNSELLLEAEQIELRLEDAKKKKLYKNLHGPRYLSEPMVIKPHTLKHTILQGQPPKISNPAIFNMTIYKTLMTIIFHFGSKLSDLLRLKIINFEINARRIKFEIETDRLLGEDVTYIPLPDSLCNWIVKPLEYRNNFSALCQDDPLFMLEKDSQFYNVDVETMESYFKSISTEFDTKINERVLYETHRSYYTDFGRLNPIISDRISNRMEPAVYIPRMYTRTSLAQMRTAHGAAFDTVCKSTGIHYE